MLICQRLSWAFRLFSAAQNVTRFYLASPRHPTTVCTINTTALYALLLYGVYALSECLRRRVLYSGTCPGSTKQKRFDSRVLQSMVSVVWPIITIVRRPWLFFVVDHGCCWIMRVLFLPLVFLWCFSRLCLVLSR